MAEKHHKHKHHKAASGQTHGSPPEHKDKTAVGRMPFQQEVHPFLPSEARERDEVKDAKDSVFARVGKDHHSHHHHHHHRHHRRRRSRSPTSEGLTQRKLHGLPTFQLPSGAHEEDGASIQLSALCRTPEAKTTHPPKELSPPRVLAAPLVFSPISNPPTGYVDLQTHSTSTARGAGPAVPVVTVASNGRIVASSASAPAPPTVKPASPPKPVSAPISAVPISGSSARPGPGPGPASAARFVPAASMHPGSAHPVHHSAGSAAPPRPHHDHHDRGHGHDAPQDKGQRRPDAGVLGDAPLPAVPPYVPFQMSASAFDGPPPFDVPPQHSHSKPAANHSTSTSTAATAHHDLPPSLPVFLESGELLSYARRAPGPQPDAKYDDNALTGKVTIIPYRPNSSNSPKDQHRTSLQSEKSGSSKESGRGPHHDSKIRVQRVEYVRCPHPGCDEVLPAETSALHIADCSHRLKSCEYCHGQYAKHELAKHHARCDCRPLMCHFCGHSFKAVVLADHEKLCVQAHEHSQRPHPHSPPRRATSEDEATAECRHCHVPVAQSMILQHEVSCDQKLQPCASCRELISVRAMAQHMTRCGGRLLHCRHCIELFPANKLSTHEATCRNAPPVVCPTCGKQHGRNGHWEPCEDPRAALVRQARALLPMRPVLGVVILADEFDHNHYYEGGLEVRIVKRDLPFHRAGIVPKDRIFMIDGHRTCTSSEFQRVLEGLVPGKYCKVTITRADAKLTLDVLVKAAGLTWEQMDMVHRFAKDIVTPEEIEEFKKNPNLLKRGASGVGKRRKIQPNVARASSSPGSPVDRLKPHSRSPPRTPVPHPRASSAEPRPADAPAGDHRAHPITREYPDPTKPRPLTDDHHTHTHNTHNHNSYEYNISDHNRSQSPVRHKPPSPPPHSPNKRLPQLPHPNDYQPRTQYAVDTASSHCAREAHHQHLRASSSSVPNRPTARDTKEADSPPYYLSRQPPSRTGKPPPVVEKSPVRSSLSPQRPTTARSPPPPDSRTCDVRHDRHASDPYVGALPCDRVVNREHSVLFSDPLAATNQSAVSSSAGESKRFFTYAARTYNVFSSDKREAEAPPPLPHPHQSPPQPPLSQPVSDKPFVVTTTSPHNSFHVNNDAAHKVRKGRQLSPPRAGGPSSSPPPPQHSAHPHMIDDATPVRILAKSSHHEDATKNGSLQPVVRYADMASPASLATPPPTNPSANAAPESYVALTVEGGTPAHTHSRRRHHDYHHHHHHQPSSAPASSSAPPQHNHHHHHHQSPVLHAHHSQHETHHASRRRSRNSSGGEASAATVASGGGHDDPHQQNLSHRPRSRSPPQRPQEAGDRTHAFRRSGGSARRRSSTHDSYSPPPSSSSYDSESSCSPPRTH